MERYYVNRTAQRNGDHEVHVETCSCIPSLDNKEDLGSFYSCQSAVQEAMRRGYNANGCAICCPDSHTT